MTLNRIMMKRLVNYCLLTILSFVLFSCSSSVSQDTPEATVDAFIKAEQSLNFKTWNNLWSQPDGFYDWQFKNLYKDSKNCTYEILNNKTRIDGDEAIVYVNVTNEEGTEESFAELSRKEGKWYVDYVNF